MATTERPPSPRRTGATKRTRGLHRHDAAVVQAEARRLALALAPYRVLRKKTLEQVSGASRWHEGGFDQALCEAVRRGMIQRLPSGFYREGDGLSRATDGTGLRPN
jgi:hypothetical protein